MFIKKLFPQGFASITGFLIVALLMVATQSVIGAISVQAENVTQEQMAALEQQKEIALAKEAAERQRQEDIKRVQAEELRLQAEKERKDVFRQAGTTFNLDEIPESTLALANKINEATPLDLRSALAAAVYSKKFDLRPSLLLAVISKESNFHQFSVGTHQDRGYMQVIPSTERFIMRSYGDALGLKYNPKRVFDPEYNLGMGAAYLGDMLKAYGDPHRALTEYNRGEGGAHRFFTNNGSYATSYSKAVLKLEKQYEGLN